MTMAKKDDSFFNFTPSTEEQQLLNGASRAEYAYVMLRAAIQRGLLKPGTRLREIELAEKLDISRTPIREALRRMESEGLISFMPPKGVMVAELDQRQIIELYAMREVLEGTAAGLAAKYASDIEIDLIDGILEKDRNSDPDDPLLHDHYNRLFHRNIYNSAHNRYLISSLDSLSNSLALLGVTTLANQERWQRALVEHQGILDAIKARDSELAEQRAREHISASLQERIRQVNQF